ncbi:MAG: hydantoinase B/oxoprolinase family protein [Candidatus Marinimicrobia bacterium]|nr:hydantoinase B/oxoprolinase family protein [Candidatus Neomarinimicrobiota bacterium]
MLSKWKFSIDRGGTFTDVIGIDPKDRLHTLKLLSESPFYDDPAIEGMRRMLNLSSRVSIPENRVARIRMGTTVATNALLERKGVPVALFITKGFRDLLKIGYQNRPELFNLVIKKPQQLYRCVKEVNERIDSEGRIVQLLDKDLVEADLKRIRRMGIQSVAIVLMHAWKNNTHEKIVGDLARKIGFKQVSVSSEIMPLIKIVGRAQTTVVDAYLSPILMNYINSVRRFTGRIPLEFMQSSGGITDAGSFTGKDAIFSGPAGGVIGSAAVARVNDLEESIGFDMGGTSTDVSRFGGTYEKAYEMEIGGIQFQVPSLSVNTVAAGGGSILWFDGQKLRVGPESAGANPGPACYGRGGPLTLTDANVLLGRIIPDYFPSTFGDSQNDQVDRDIVVRKFEEITRTINNRLNYQFTPVEVALGFVKIANETMAKAIKEISVSRGFDIRQHALICFGGAAAQHACAIAKILGIRTIIIHPLAGLLSAYGIAMADHLQYAATSVIKKMDSQSFQILDKEFSRLEQPLIEDLREKNIPKDQIVVSRFLDLRPMGTDSYLSIPFVQSIRELEQTFFSVYQQHYGFDPSETPLELVNLRVEVIGKGDDFRYFEENQKGMDSLRYAQGTVTQQNRPLNPIGIVEVYWSKQATPTHVYKREEIDVHTQIQGPAIVVEDYSTTVVEPGFSVRLNKFGHLILTQTKVETEIVGGERDPVMLEVFNHLFMSVAEQMGYTLENSAHSVNIKERLDFSCAIFDCEGNLVANAPHIPVHLGAMGESVKSIIRDNQGKMKRGDIYVMNNPHRGGSHLPDVTVIAPIFGEDNHPIFYTANRGHHADIGGITPGSMPPFGKNLAEEGVVIDNFLLVRDNRFREKEVRELLLSGPYPARNIDERISDLKAQIAAIRNGERELRRLVDKYSLNTVHAYMDHIRDNAAEAMRDALAVYLGDRKKYENYFEDYLDNGSKIAVKISITWDGKSPDTCRVIVDFEGTDHQMSGNLNAPVAVTKAAVLYVFRTLIDEDIPLNSGCLDPIDIRIPAGCLLNPSSDAAVVGGNVETSQRVVDVLLGALGIAAASQGTMNNFLFGRADGKGKQYYETIAGGSGATTGHPGASAVQVHMTNTRITDPEVLEQRYPELRLESFAIRYRSGGKGKYKGGDGTIRKIRFLQPRKISILSERRKYPPYGMAGGSPGTKGKNILIKKDGTYINLGGKVERVVHPGETIVIKTPGGGGFGRKDG